MDCKRTSENRVCCQRSCFAFRVLDRGPPSNDSKLFASSLL